VDDRLHCRHRDHQQCHHACELDDGRVHRQQLHGRKHEAVLQLLLQRQPSDQSGRGYFLCLRQPCQCLGDAGEHPGFDRAWRRLDLDRREPAPDLSDGDVHAWDFDFLPVLRGLLYVGGDDPHLYTDIDGHAHTDGDAHQHIDLYADVHLFADEYGLAHLYGDGDVYRHPDEDVDTDLHGDLHGHGDLYRDTDVHGDVDENGHSDTIIHLYRDPDLYGHADAFVHVYRHADLYRDTHVHGHSDLYGHPFHHRDVHGVADSTLYGYVDGYSDPVADLYQ
jgi:hypothetical protein